MDFIKNDCVFGANFNTSGTYTNIEAARKAMDKTGHTFVYSLSPGFGADTPGPDGPANALKITSPLVNMYRMTSDWHGWHGADNKPGWPNHFELAGTYSSYIGAAGAHGLSWPDLDSAQQQQRPRSAAHPLTRRVAAGSAEPFRGPRVDGDAADVVGDGPQPADRKPQRSALFSAFFYK